LAVDKETQREIEDRLRAAGYKEPQTYVLEHGYGRSVYVTDPNDMIIEFTVDNPQAEKVAPERKQNARSELNRWLAGDHTSNNTYR
jgi:glyoxylase I family protein